MNASSPLPTIRMEIFRTALPHGTAGASTWNFPSAPAYSRLIYDIHADRCHRSINMPNRMITRKISEMLGGHVHNTMSGNHAYGYCLMNRRGILRMKRSREGRME
jgi:hypothetical protein